MPDAAVAGWELAEVAASADPLPRRAEHLPRVPTLGEAGIAGVDADAWFALFAPASTPAAAVERLYAAVADALERPAAKETLARQGMTLALRRPAELAAMLPAEVEKWAAVIKAANVKLD